MLIRAAIGGILVLGPLFVARAAAAEDRSVEAQLAGSYTLASIYDLLKDGKKNDTWGEGVKGSLFLAPSGQFSVQIVAAGRDKAASKSPRVPVGPIVTYSGTYTVDGGGKGLTYHVERSSFPGWDGIDRKIVIESMAGGELKLVSTVHGDSTLGDFKAYQTWKRSER